MAESEPRRWKKEPSEPHPVGPIEIDISEVLAGFEFNPQHRAPIAILAIGFRFLDPALEPALFRRTVRAERVGHQSQVLVGAIVLKPFWNDQGLAHRGTSMGR